MDSLARISKAIEQLTKLRRAVAPFSRSAATVLSEVVAVLEAERTAAITRRVEAGKQI